MNPSAWAIMMKAQQLLDPAFVGWIGARSQSPYFARGFVLVQELDDHHSAAQELLGQFARRKRIQLQRRKRLDIF